MESKEITRPTITKRECRQIREEDGTPGGVTYHITKKGRWSEEAPLCFRRLPNNNSFRCAREAGFGTWHRGTGACRWCGGNAGRKPSTGRQSKMARIRLGTEIQEYLDGNMQTLFDLRFELATVKAMFAEFMEGFPEPEDKDYGINLQRAQQLVGTIGTLMDKMSKVESRDTLTISQVLYTKAVVADILMRYVPEGQRERAVADLVHRLGGDKHGDIAGQIGLTG